MKEYARLINENNIEFPPHNDEKRGIYNYHVNYDLLKEDNWKPLRRVKKPNNGKIYSPCYTDNGEEIVQTWIEVVPPQPITPQESPEVSRENLYRSLTDGWEAELAYKTRKGYPADELKAIEAKIDEAREKIKQMYPDVGD